MSKRKDENMKVRIISKKGDKLSFVLEESTPAFANAIRRIMTSEVPTMAIEWVDMMQNNSALFDEIIAHRLGMIPLVFEPDKFNFTDECKCEGKGCPLCQVVFVAEATGPRIVYSGDMKSSNKEVKPTDPNFPIIELLKGQSIKFEAVAKLGFGSKHAKFQAANVAYKYYPEIKVMEGASQKDLEKGVKACPKGALSMKGSKTVLDSELCNFSRSCEAASNGSIKIEGDQTRFIFEIETVSGLEPTYIVEKAAEILGAKAEEFKKELKDI